MCNRLNKITIYQMFLTKINIYKKTFQKYMFPRKDNNLATKTQSKLQKINTEISAVKQNVNNGYNKINK
jgi:hypothetical protein